MTDLTVARTILTQMGGAERLNTFIDAGPFVGSEDGLAFRFKGSRKVNKCRVTLDRGSDTYRVEFSRVRSTTVYPSAVSEYSSVYAEDLIPLFESATGLHLHL